MTEIAIGRRTVLVCASCTVVFLGSFSCVSASRAAAAPLRIDTCALISPSEISQIIEFEVGAGKSSDAGPQRDGSYSSSCLWIVESRAGAAVNPEGPLEGRSFVILSAIRWPAGSQLAWKYLESFRKAAAKGDIPGTPSPRTLGDEALSWGDGLAVRTGDVGFGISVFIPNLSNTVADDLEQQLAQRILRHL
jgi:hypothetical protein